MNQESFMYSVLASILGISIVLIALFVFNLVMVGLNALFADRKKMAKAEIPVGKQEAPLASSAGIDDTGWICAAVAAYLSDGEEETVPQSVLSWQPEPVERYNPWIHAPHVNQTWTGV